MPDTTPPSPTPDPGSGHTKHAFLVGEEVYFRPPLKADAAFAMSWRQQRNPVSTEATETWINDELGKASVGWYLIIRKADDRPVGSIIAHRDGLFSTLTPFVDRLLESDGDRLQAEAIGMLLRWITDERQQATVAVTLPADHYPLSHAAASAADAEPAVRVRSAWPLAGRRHDLVTYQRLSPTWMTTLGDPRTASSAPEPAEVVPVPAGRAWPLAGTPRAIRASERLAVRPAEPTDGEIIAARERQASSDAPLQRRLMRAPGQLGAAITQREKQAEPTEIDLAVCRVGSETPIGLVGLREINLVMGTASVALTPAGMDDAEAVDALHLLAGYAFETLMLQALQARVMRPDRSLATRLQQAGYRPAGVLRWRRQAAGNLDDEFALDLLAADWRALPRAGADHA